MPQTKAQKQLKALEILTETLAEQLANGQGAYFAQTIQYNSLKRKLAPLGLTHEGRI